MVSIKEFAALCRTTVKTIRFYDNCGLLRADYISRENGCRYYRKSAAAQYYKIAALKEAGFSLKEIRKQLYDLSMEQVLVMLDKRLDLLERQRELCLTLRKGAAAGMEEANRYQMHLDQARGEVRITRGGGRRPVLRRPAAAGPPAGLRRNRAGAALLTGGRQGYRHRLSERFCAVV